MKYLLSSIFLVALLIFSFSQQPPAPEAEYLSLYQSAEKEYLEAERLFLRKDYSEEQEAALNRSALKKLLQVLPAIVANQQDSLSFLGHYMTASLFDYFDSLNHAKEYYQYAVQIKKRAPRLPDSMLFKPLLFIGSVHYSQHAFDSAVFYYKEAEAITDLYQQPLADEQRLYNRLGVIQYETGNYRQAKNYFEKALALLPPTDLLYREFKANYQNNIASALLNLEKYDTAKTLYLQLLSTDLYKNEVTQNLGLIDLSLGDPASAIRWFKKADTTDRNTIFLYNKIARAYLELKKKDSAARYLEMAGLENQKRNGKTKNVAYGLTFFYKAELALSENQLRDAIHLFQQSVIQFHNDFSDSSSYRNPESFNGVFSYIQLFNALSEKAEALSLLYRQQKEIPVLESALDAYQSAFRLASYVERTYDSDEARLFLGKIKHHVHSKPIDISILLYELTGKINYLEQAYHFDQLNKASILALNIQENELRKTNGRNSELLEKESLIKRNITRLSLNAARLTDSNTLKTVVATIRDHEIELGKLQEKINEQTDWNIRDAGLQIPGVSQLQRKLDNNSALLSYHLSDHELLVLLISNRKFEYYKTEIDPGFFERLEHFKQLLQNGAVDQRYEGSQAAQALYQVLIKPLYPSLKQYSRLVIIPDDELNYLPFEALQDEHKKYLLEQFSVQYQFSTALFGENPQSGYLAKSLAFAPFTNAGFPEDAAGTFYSVLPASKDEVENLNGKILTDTSATKKNFLRHSNSYPLLHLATHATVNNDTPAHSYIAFYPHDRDYKLYAGEIASLRLDSVKLVILSACETGTGKLIKGEGLMSLSRAFAYAGCPDIITSLWKAEDRTTSFITQRLHYYLEKRYSKDMALQQAKLDLLKSNEIDPRYKTPDYWAHLIYIGNYEEDRGSKAWWWIALAIIGGAFLYKMVGRKK